MNQRILIDGLSEKEIKELSKGIDFQNIIFTNEPVVFTAGTSEILGKFQREENCIKVNLAHIDGGGEGVLLKLSVLFHQFARENEIEIIEWIVHAVNCPKPNPKLRKILALKSFEVCEIENEGLVYYKKENLKII